MGVEAVSSDGAKAFVLRERILGGAITVLGEASQCVESLDRDTLSRCGDLAHDLLPFAPGYAGKLLVIISRLFSSAAGLEGGYNEKVRSLSQMQDEIEQLQATIG